MIAIYLILVLGILVAAAWLFMQEARGTNEPSGEASILNRLGLSENPAPATPAPGSSFTSHLSFFKKHEAAAELAPAPKEPREEILPQKEIPVEKPADSDLAERYKRLEGLFEEKRLWI